MGCRFGKKDPLAGGTFSSSPFSSNAVFPTSTPKELPKEELTVDDPTDLYITTKDISKDVKRIEERPVLTLEESLRSLYPFFPNLPEQIAESKKACNKSEKYGITCDESAALYFTGTEAGKEIFRVHVKNGLPIEDFLKLFFNGYYKLPKLKKDVWLVIPYDDEWAKILDTENPQLQTRIGPAAISIYGAKEYLNKQYGPPKIIVRIQNPHVANMAGYIKNGQRETILYPAINLEKVRDTQYYPNGTRVYHLRVVDKTKTPIPHVHFVCPAAACGHQCKHQTSDCGGYCTGCELIIHRECHHCPYPPVIQCSFCSKFYSESWRCKKCQGIFCQKCSMKTIPK